MPLGASASGKLTLADAYTLALKNHESIAIAGERLDQSESATRGAYAGILPTLTVDAAYRKYSEEKSAGEPCPSAPTPTPLCR